MKKLFLTGIAALFLATGTAHASYQKKVRAPVIPPHKYDHPYPGRVTIARIDSTSLPCRPNSMSTSLGCAFLEDLDKKGNYHDAEKEAGKECYIYLASDDEIKEAGYTPNAMLRHEMAGCNGWPGYRTLGENWIWEEKDFK
jgi:hypothetical protein